MPESLFTHDYELAGLGRTGRHGGLSDVWAGLPHLTWGDVGGSLETSAVAGVDVPHVHGAAGAAMGVDGVHSRRDSELLT